MNQVHQLEEWLQAADHIVFFGGAGVSTESGIPDFRSAQGLYMEEIQGTYQPEEIVSHSFLMEHPVAFFDYYFKHLVFPDAQPNATHRYLAALEEAGKRVSIVTQNIDGLHQKAGSKEVYELHGSVWDNYCLTCGRAYAYSDLSRDDQGIPRCPEDGGMVRPRVVLYQEGLDQGVLYGAIEAISQADLMIVAGTSLVVYPAAGLVNYFEGDHLAVINKTPVAVAQSDVLVIQDSLGKVFEPLEADLD